MRRLVWQRHDDATCVRRTRRNTTDNSATQTASGNPEDDVAVFGAGFRQELATTKRPDLYCSRVACDWDRLIQAEAWNHHARKTLQLDLRGLAIGFLFGLNVDSNARWRRVQRAHGPYHPYAQLSASHAPNVDSELQCCPRCSDMAQLQ